jgi:hypothetical protein
VKHSGQVQNMKHRYPQYEFPVLSTQCIQNTQQMH